MLPYLVAGLIGAGAAMSTKDKKKARKKYAKGGQLSYDEKRNLLTDATIREVESYGMKAFFQDMSLFAQEAGKDAPIGFFQDTCNFVEWAQREGIVKTRKATEADIEEEINDTWTESVCQRILKDDVSDRLKKKIYAMDIEELDDFDEVLLEEAQEDGDEEEYIQTLRDDQLEMTSDDILHDICVYVDDVDVLVSEYNDFLDESLTITQFNDRFNIVDVDALMEYDEDECEERASSICAFERWSCHEISYGGFMIFN